MENIIIDKQSDWGGNFQLHIQNKAVEHNIVAYTICSLYQGAEIGFELQVPVEVKPFGEAVIFKSIGKRSDHFVTALFDVYGLHLQDHLKFIEQWSVNYASLNDIMYKGNGQQRLPHINYLKVFFESVNENAYAELYINIDEKHGTIEFEEKDYAYRPYIAMLLSTV